MKTLEIFDPVLSYFDPALIQFVANLKWVEKFGVNILRYNFSQEPQVFAANPAVYKEMNAGMNRLPIILIDGNIASTGIYPSRQQLAQILGIAAAEEEISHVETTDCCCKPWLGLH